MENALIIFIKNPEEGNVKTRLAKTVGKEKALHIYKALLYHTKEIAKNVHADKYIFYSSFINENDDWENSIFKKHLQIGDDLGLKMQNAFENVFNYGYKKVCIIGSDCPELTAKIIEEAFNKLDENDVVIGPAFDGGYYLLGMKSLNKNFFNDMEWSTQHVLQTTIKRCQENNLTYFLLDALHDVDEEKDLIYLNNAGE